jgi:hypothetical protein
MGAFIPLALLAAGAVARGVGNRRDASKARKQVVGVNKQQSSRASSRTALARGILDANGFGGIISDKDLEMAMQPTPNPIPGVPSAFGPVGAGLSGLGQAILMGSAGQQQQEQSNDDWWEEFYQQLANNRAGFQGASRSGPSGPFSYGDENRP